MFIPEAPGIVVTGMRFHKHSQRAFPKDRGMKERPKGVGMNDRQVKAINVQNGCIIDLVVNSE